MKPIWRKALFLDPTSLFRGRLLPPATSLLQLLTFMRDQIQAERHYFIKALYTTTKTAPQILNRKRTYHNQRLIKMATDDILTPQMEMINEEIDMLELELDMLMKLIHMAAAGTTIDVKALYTQLENEEGMFAARRTSQRATTQKYMSLEEGTTDSGLMNIIRRELLNAEEKLEAHEKERLKMLLVGLERFAPHISQSTPHAETAGSATAMNMHLQPSAKHAVKVTSSGDGDASSDEEDVSEKLPISIKPPLHSSTTDHTRASNYHIHHHHYDDNMFEPLIPLRASARLRR